jgi:hypothetical protein
MVASYIQCRFLTKIMDKTAKIKLYQDIRGYNCNNAAFHPQ